jgi:hypothetical protein
MPQRTAPVPPAPEPDGETVKLPQSFVEVLKRQREKAEAERRRKRAGINLKPPTAGDEFALRTLLSTRRRQPHT